MLIALLGKDVQFKSVRHINVRHLQVRQFVRRREMVISHLPTNLMPSNNLTKR